MTTFRLLDGQSGRPGTGSSGTQPPSSPTSATGPWLLGTMFTITGGMRWLNGYYFWTPPGGDTGPQKFATWNVYANGTGIVVPGSTVTSGTLTAASFNYVPLTSPVQLAPGEIYVAATGWTAVSGIPLTSGQFGSGDPYSAGITSGPVTAWPNMSAGGTSPFPWATTFNLGQGLFSNVLGNDPGAAMPNNGSGSDLFWVDVAVSDTAPAGYAGSYRLRPAAHGLGATSNIVTDTANPFTLGVEFSVSAAVTVGYIWFYSLAGLTQLPTAIAIYEVTGTTLIASNSSPGWSAAAGAGWVKAAFSGGVTLQPGVNYKACALNAVGTTAWNQAITSFWASGNGFGGSGLTAGPAAFPNTSAATSPGQASYNAGSALAYPATNAGPYDYGLDIEVTPVASGSGLLMATAFP